MFYKASLDMLSKIVTAATALFFLFFAIMAFTSWTGMPYILLLPCAILLATVFGTYLYSPLGYEITLDSIQIVRKINKFHIQRNNILSITPLSADELGRAWRTFGNAGMFRYTGWFRSANQGSMRWFVSQRKNYVCILTTDHKKYILSPDDVEGFIKAATQW